MGYNILVLYIIMSKKISCNAGEVMVVMFNLAFKECLVDYVETGVDLLRLRDLMGS